jgi:hypothetical protein
LGGTFEVLATRQKQQLSLRRPTGATEEGGDGIIMEVLVLVVSVGLFLYLWHALYESLSFLCTLDFDICYTHSEMMGAV